MKLYEISSEYINILDDTFDSETGEVNEQAVLKLEEVKDNLKNKGIAIASFIKNLDAEKKAVEEAKKSMAERESRLNKKIDYLTDYLKFNMEKCNIDEISCAYFSVKLKKCPISVDVINEEDIPDCYKKIKQIVSLDKIKIKEEISKGIYIQGASLKQNTRIDIR